MPRNANTAWWAMRIDPDLRAEIDADRQAKGQTLSEWSVRAARLALGKQPEERFEQAAGGGLRGEDGVR